MKRFSMAYELLGLDHTASMDEVKRAYRRMALRYHPDLNSDKKAPEKFIQVKKAYEIILTADRNWNQRLAEEILKKDVVTRSRDRDKVKLTREEAMRRAREKARKFEAIRMQRDARQFAKFKKSVYYPWTMAMSYLSLIFFVLIISDAFMANRVHQGYIVSKAPITFNALGMEITTGYRLEFDNGDEVVLGVTPASQIKERSHISMAETMIFRDVPNIYVVNSDFKEFVVSGFNKPPYLFFLMFIFVPILILLVDRPSAVFYSAGAFARYGVIVFILSFLVL